jgi:hypothetical protein
MLVILSEVGRGPDAIEGPRGVREERAKREPSQHERGSFNPPMLLHEVLPLRCCAPPLKMTALVVRDARSPVSIFSAMKFISSGRTHGWP